ncbi:hypothetical protein [Flavobacterium rhizosphaerae]|uniref:Lipoprotein n=1 Tax=Flavobacterium rhizosphaerae TaxID=3163298 RepID=A0ABW8Z014_9FLAO
MEQQKIKSFYIKSFLLAFISIITLSCGVPRHAVEIHDYELLENGKQITGKDKGLTAFIFENNPTKIPFVQFLSEKYHVGKYKDVSYWVETDGYRFKVFLYDTDELNKYFDMGQFMVTTNVTENNIVGSTEKFIGLSMITEYNEDCLNENSLLQKIAINYLKSLKNEFNNL